MDDYYWKKIQEDQRYLEDIEYAKQYIHDQYQYDDYVRKRQEIHRDRIDGYTLEHYMEMEGKRNKEINDRIEYIIVVIGLFVSIFLFCYGISSLVDYMMPEYIVTYETGGVQKTDTIKAVSVDDKHPFSPFTVVNYEGKSVMYKYIDLRRGGMTEKTVESNDPIKVISVYKITSNGNLKCK